MTKRENSGERDRGVKGRAGDTILRRALIMSQPFQRHRCHVALFLRVLFGRARIWNNQSRFTEIATRIVPQGLDDVGRNALESQWRTKTASRTRERIVRKVSPVSRQLKGAKESSFSRSCLRIRFPLSSFCSSSSFSSSSFTDLLFHGLVRILEKTFLLIERFLRVLRVLQ